MKYCLLLLAASIVFFTSCEHTKHIYKKTSFPSPFEYVRIDSAPGSKDELYDKAYKWITKITEQNVFTVDTQNKKEGHIVGTGTLKFNTTNVVIVNHEVITYKINIAVKDGKYKCVLSNFTHSSKGVKNGSSYKNEKPKYYDYSLGDLSNEDPKGTDKKRWDNIKDESAYEAKKIIRSFNTAMQKEIKTF